MTRRHTRCQGAIVKDHHLLLIKTALLGSGISFWLLPGGGMEAGETPEICVVREMKEETGLDVDVERLIYEGPALPGGEYQKLKTYLCRVVGGEEAPGSEPEVVMAVIAALRWVDLRDESGWGDEICQDEFTYPHLALIRDLLGYNDDPEDMQVDQAA